MTGCALKERSGFLPDRTVHLHVTRRCNLACAHCYSSSSPQQREMLPLALLQRTLGLLRTEGYETISLSGGEPLLYPDLEALIDHAHDLGYRVSAITNGYHVKPANDAVLMKLDAIAVSFDGMEAAHDRMRGRKGAYQDAIRALEHLRVIGKPVAAAFTVSRESLPSIPEFVRVALDLGVSAVQLRPLVMAGRARDGCDGVALGEEDVARLFLIGAALESAYEGEIAVHTDLAPAPAIVAGREDYRALLEGNPANRRLADMVNPLVVTPGGALKPLTFDFPDAFDLGRLEHLTKEGVAQIKSGPMRDLRALLHRVFDDMEDSHALVDWFAHCRDEAASMSETSDDISALFRRGEADGLMRGLSPR